jgi:peptide methionine sulfoxide reductase MsrB
MNIQLIDTPTDVVDAAHGTQLAHAARCRLCGSHLEHVFVDLGSSPLCQTVITPE